jgi:hypothetical protein
MKKRPSKLNNSRRLAALLILLFFNMLVCAYSGGVGWLLFWAIAFSSCAHEYGYEYGKTEAQISSQIPCRTDL